MHLKFKNLVEIVASLRAEGGCPWDREQTLESMNKCMFDEAQELKEAIEKGDLENIEEEMGDLLLCLAMMAQIAKEDKKFDMGSIIEKVAEKVVSRQNWVFGTDKAETEEEAVKLWLKNKEKERKKRK